MDFMSQTNSKVILDRFYPCELIYAEAFDRETDMSVISWMDRKFSDADGKFIVCVRKNYEGLVDDQYPDDLPVEMLKKLDGLYRTFAETTECDCLVLETDDFNLGRQISDIMSFLESQEKYYEFS